jgi:hypothetical protein
VSSKTVVYIELAPALCPTKCGRVLLVEEERWNPRLQRWTGRLRCAAGHHVHDTRQLYEARPHDFAKGAQPALF